MRLARIATVGLVGMGLAWGCGSSDDTTLGGNGGSSGSDAAAGAGASAGTTGDAGSGASAGSGGQNTGGAATTGGSSGSGGAGAIGGGLPGGSGGSAGSATGGSAGAAGTAGTAGLGGFGGTAGTAGSAGTTDGGVADVSIPPIDCEVFGTTCASGSECCSKLCDPVSDTCVSTLTTCTPATAPCITGSDCCSLRCEGNLCQAEQCVGDNDACTSDGECCGGDCSGTCTPLNPLCRTSGNDCTLDSECCSKYCNNGLCDIAPSWCIQTGDVCSRAEDCCSGACTFASGRSSGTCALPPEGAGCTGKAIEGQVCAGFNDCGSCCSKLCAPSAAGRFVCQPTSGCRTEGGLCRSDSDCCGVGGTGLPGDGNGNCEIAFGQTIGFCKTISCIPQGQVCHYSGGLYVCESGTSDPNSCCGATGSSGRCIADASNVLRCNGFEECPAGSQANDSCSLCMLDELGIPRCNGLDACRQPGETCSNSGDCCEGLPCIPDDQGVLRCLNVPDGGDTCQQAGDTCTVDADCCPGSTCIRPPGSIFGTCGVVDPPPPPTDGGVNPPPDGGVNPPPDGSVNPPPDGEPPPPPPDADPPPPPVCSAYGQGCSGTSDCCNTNLGVVCYNQTCRLPPP